MSSDYQHSLAENALKICLQSTDNDARIRCQYTIPGAETFRFVASSDPFGYGESAERHVEGMEEDKGLPNA